LLAWAMPDQGFLWMPLLVAGGVLVVGATFQVVMLLADLIYSWLNPRLRLGGHG